MRLLKLLIFMVIDVYRILITDKNVEDVTFLRIKTSVALRYVFL